jgi:hypothetical protein
MVVTTLLQIVGLLFVAKVVEQLFALKHFEGFVKIIVLLTLFAKGG